MTREDESGGEVGPFVAHSIGPMHASSRVARDLLPLPLLGGQDLPKTNLSRGCRQRWLRRERRVDDCNAAIRALNYLNSPGSKNDAGPIHSLQTFRASAAQAEALLRIQTAVDHLGPPPDDVTVPEALRQLRCEGYVDDLQATGALASFNPEGVSLPEEGWKPISLASLGGRDGGVSVGDYVQQQVLPPELASARVEACGVKYPYTDPKLRDPKVYGAFLGRLARSNLVDFSTQAGAEHISLFFVRKKNGKLRMIIDARRSNQHFRDPDHVQLCTGDTLSRFEIDGEEDLTICQADLKDAFYHLSLPESLRKYFVLPPIDGRYLKGVCLPDGTPVGSGLKVFPRLAVVPMGWSWALFICQNLHEQIVEASGLSEGQRLRDGRPCPSAAVAHTQYVDNLVVLGQDRSAVVSAFQHAVEHLKAAGLQVHEEEICDGGACVLGWEFEASGIFRPSARRVWRARLAIRALLARRRASGKQIERLVGLCSFICLARRESLSVFGDVYQFIARYRDCGREIRMPPGVRRELHMWDAISPLIFKDLRSPWSEQVTAVDASFWGLGATSCHMPLSEVHRLGRYSKRWRFAAHEAEQELPHRGARDCAFQQLRGDGLDSDKPTADFEAVPFSAVNREWSTIGCHRWRRTPTLPVGEARASLFALKHAARTLSGFGKRHLVLTDSMTGALAISRGRSSTFQLRRVCSQVAALSFASGIQLCLRWIPSEWNPADNPSRGVWQPSVPSRAAKDALPGDLVCPSKHRGEDSAVKQETHGEPDGPTGSQRSKLFASSRSGTAAGQEGSTTRQPCSTANSCRKPNAPRAGICVNRLSSSLSAPVGGGCSASLFQPRGAQRHEHRRDDSVSAVGGAVPGRLQPGEWAIPDCSRDLLQPLAEVASHASGEAISAGLAEASSAPGPPSDPLRGGGAHGSDGVCQRADFNRPFPAPGLCALPSALRGAKAAKKGRYQASSEARHFESLAVRPQPFGRGRAFQDSRVRRDPAAGLEVPSRVGRSHPSMSGTGQIVKQSEDFSAREQRHQRFHDVGAGAVEPPAFGAPAFVPAPPWGCQLRLQQPFSGPRFGPAARSLEKPQQCSSLPEGWTSGSVVRSSQPRNAASRYQGGHRSSGHSPQPALMRALPDPKVFVEIFSASGRLAAAVCQRTGWPTLLWDIDLGAEYDLLSRKNQCKLVGWLRSGRLCGAHLGTPCSSFTRARDHRPGPPPLRSDAMPLGLPGLEPHDQRNIRIGNAFMRFSARFLGLCANLHVPCTLENPLSSRLWLCPPVRRVLRRRFVSQHRCDYCMCGTPWKKPTLFVAAHVNLDILASLRCNSSKRGLCQRTGRPHVPLAGQTTQGRWLTQVAEPYPKPLCRILAVAFYNVHVRALCDEFSRHVLPEKQ